MKRLRPLTAARAASYLSDVRALMAQPEILEQRLTQRGYTVVRSANGLRALPGRTPPETLIVAPLHQAAPVAISGLFATGANVAHCGAIVAAMQAATPTTAMLFLHDRLGESGGLPGRVTISLEGGVTPRVWPGCVGSIDLLIRCLGRRSVPGMPNVAINALEGAIPVLSALRAAALQPTALHRNAGSREAPLTARLSIIAAHGGTPGTAPPSLFDIVVTRRYGPDETAEGVTGEIEALVRQASGPDLRTEVSVIGRTPPQEDPERASWTREQFALANGWNWPQSPFRSTTPLVSNSVLFGGLERSGFDAASASSSISMEEIGALSMSLTTYLV